MNSKREQELVGDFSSYFIDSSKIIGILEEARTPNGLILDILEFPPSNLQELISTLDYVSFNIKHFVYHDNSPFFKLKRDDVEYLMFYFPIAEPDLLSTKGVSGLNLDDGKVVKRNEILEKYMHEYRRRHLKNMGFPVKSYSGKLFEPVLTLLDAVVRLDQSTNLSFFASNLIREYLETVGEIGRPEICYIHYISSNFLDEFFSQRKISNVHGYSNSPITNGGIDGMLDLFGIKKIKVNSKILKLEFPEELLEKCLNRDLRDYCI